MDMHYETGTKIRVTFVDGQKLVGKVDHYTSAADSPDDVQELTIIPTKGEFKHQYINFHEDEVKQIEVIK